MSDDVFWRVEDVMDFLKCSRGKAYAIMRKLNAELVAAGKITIRGRVPRLLVIRRTCGEDAIA